MQHQSATPIKSLHTIAIRVTSPITENVAHRSSTPAPSLPDWAKRFAASHPAPFAGNVPYGCEIVSPDGDGLKIEATFSVRQGKMESFEFCN